MATIAPRKARQPVKRTNLFYEQTNRFLFKVLLWFFGLSLFCSAFKFVPVPFTPLMVIQTVKQSRR
jgi:monofunctional biosynthetic peptidoglycan transglycosylase